MTGNSTFLALSKFPIILSVLSKQNLNPSTSGCKIGGVMSCWKINVKLSSLLQLVTKFPPKTSLALAASIFPSTLTSFSVSVEEKHSSSVMQPATCGDGMIRVICSVFKRRGLHVGHKGHCCSHLVKTSSFISCIPVLFEGCL